MAITVRFSREKINPVYRPYIESNNPYEIYYGGAGSGKSFFVGQKLLLRCMKDDYFRLVFSRKQAVDIRDSQFLLFKDLINEYGLNQLFKIKESNMDIHCINGNRMMSAGMDNPEKIKSIQKPTHVWCEEITEFDYEDFEQLDLRLRGDGSYPIQYLMSLNPINEEHWVKKELFDKDLKNSMKLKTTYLDNQFINQKEYEEKLNRQSPHNQRIYKFGDWGMVRTGMEYFPDFDSSKHVTDRKLYDPKLPLHVTFDMNANPYMTMLICQIVFDNSRDGLIQVNVIDEYCLRHPLNKTMYVCQKFMQEYREHNAGVFYYGDATSEKNNTMTVDEIRHDYDIVENVLRTKLSNSSYRVSVSNPPVLKRKDFVGYVLRETTPLRILIQRNCKETVNDFLYLKEGADGKKFKEKAEEKITGAKYQKYGHTSDAFEYFICRAFERLFDQYVRR